MYLEKKSKNWKQKMLDSLSNNEEYEQLIYWRKCYEINDWFCNNINVENCEHIKVSKEELLELIEYLGCIKFEDDYFKSNQEIKQLNKVIEETDWDNEEIYYYAWW